MHVRTRQDSHARWQTLPLGSVQLKEGFWQRWQRTNRQVTIPHGYRMLVKSGNLNNLRLAAGQGEGEYRLPVFMDSDVFKWLEAASYDLANAPDAQLDALVDKVISVVAAAQQPDGYLNSYYQVNKPEQRWTNLDHDHELYCAGHLFEAAVAHHRATGKDSLLAVACRFADHIAGVFGPDKRKGAPGHPEIELALVELYRETGARRYLDLAQFFIDQRGKGLMKGHGLWGAAYHQDAVPVRQSHEVMGHAVRQLYLTSGVADLYLETGEPALYEAQQRLWHNLTHHKMHLIGGYGACDDGEAFGADYELPNDTCYCETCAAIAGMMWNWRLLLATGDPRYASLLERSLYNGFLSGVALDGTHFFYVNPLSSPGGIERPEWYGCACCPPNVMRQIAVIGHYLATIDDTGVQLHQYAPAVIHTGFRQGAVVLDVTTDYPWEGQVAVRIQQTDGATWTLQLRVPTWAQGTTVAVNDERAMPAAAGAMQAVTRAWRAGDVVHLTLPMRPRWIEANPRVDATRGALALEYGPLVYCLESVDQARGVDLRDVAVSAGAEVQAAFREDLLGGVVTLRLPGSALAAGDLEGWLYRPYGGPEIGHDATTLTAVPYYAWANRGGGAMRVWLPRQ
jgi:hypothetical protein